MLQALHDRGSEAEVEAAETSQEVGAAYPILVERLKVSRRPARPTLSRKANRIESGDHDAYDETTR